MARQVINNGESGSAVRAKLNENFAELYAGKDAVTVANYAALPDPTTVSGERWWVLASTGVWFVNRFLKGAYYSDGVAWSYMGDFAQAAAEITNTPAGTIAAVNVQDAIDELDDGLTAQRIFIGTSAPDPAVYKLWVDTN